MKFLNFFKKSPSERGRALRGKWIQLGLRTCGARFFLKDHTYLTYHPDSFNYSERHPEFSALFEKFSVNNELNNGGDVSRLWALMLNLKQLEEEGIPGDFAELGVWRGNTAALFAHYAKAKRRTLFLFDTFSGFDEKDIAGIDAKETAKHFSDTSLELVKQVVGASPELCCHFVKGYFPESITEQAKAAKYAAVSLDCDLYKPMKAGLEFFYPRLSRGGFLFLHDYSSPFWDGAKKAVDEFCAASGEFITLLPDKSGSALLRKTKA